MKKFIAILVLLVPVLASGQTNLENCDVDTLTCDITLQFDWNHITSRTDATPFDVATELSTYQLEIGTEVTPFSVEPDPCGSAGPCLTTSANTLSAPVALEVTKADILDDGQTLVGFRIRGIDTLGKLSEWNTITDNFVFPQALVNALTAAPSAVINFRFTVIP